MTQIGNERSEDDANGDRRLDYASSGSVSGGRTWSLAGLLSLALMVLLYPWGAAWFLLLWLNDVQIDSRLLTLIDVLPVFVALCFGTRSLWTHGISWKKNFAGVIGFTVSATLILLAVVAWCLQR
jgi:hypothetical protein